MAKLVLSVGLLGLLIFGISLTAFGQQNQIIKDNKKAASRLAPQQRGKLTKKAATNSVSRQTLAFLKAKMAVKRAKQDKMRERQLNRFDEPEEAIQFYLKKRLPEGEKELPVEKYLEAWEAVKNMPLYSTVKGRFLNEAEKNEALTNSKLAEGPEALGTWSPLGPGNIGGRTRALLIDPTNASVMYAAGVAGGVWKTTNGGSSWSALTDTLSNIAVSSLAMDPNNPNVIYAGTGEGFLNGDAVRGAGIFKTDNGGASWSALSPTTSNTNFYYVNDIVVSKVNSQNVYAATRTGIWRSLNGGASWTQVLNGSGVNGCLDLAIRTDQAAVDYIFASCGTFTQATIYRNTDAAGAGTWVSSYTDTGMRRTSLAIAPSNQNVIYALASNSSHAMHKVLRSTNGGATWTTQVDSSTPNITSKIQLSNPVFANYDVCFSTTGNNSTGGQGWYDNVIAVDPLDSNRVWTGGVDLFRSDDGGANWGQASHWWAASTNPRFVHADNHTIVFHPQYDGTNNKTMFVGNDGGVFRTTDARAATATGATAMCNTNNGSVFWTSLNNGYAVTQFYHGVPYPNGTTYFGGTQDNGTIRGTDAGGANAWSSILGGDGGYVAVDPTNTNNLYAETQNTDIRKSTDGGASFSPAKTGIVGSGEFITPFTMDPSNSQRLWTGTSVMYRTINGAGTWVQSSAALGANVSAIAISRQDGNRILAGTGNGTVRRTTTGLTDAAASVWASSTPRNAYVSSVAFDPNNSSIAYATYSTFGGTKVFRSTDGGAIWTGIGGTGVNTLPDIPVHSIVIDPGNSNRLYIGTDIGVFTSADSGANWVPENTGFPNTIVESLAINTVGSNSTLFAFTHGRGVWRVSLSSVVNCVPTAIVFGQTVNGTLDSSCTNTNGHAVKSYTFSGTANQQIAIEMNTTSGFDTYLELYNGTQLIAFDDDGGVNFNSRIPADNGFFTLPSTATYTIKALGYMGATGSYTLSLQTASCSYSINPTSVPLAATSSTGNTVAVTATSGCQWTASTAASWITINSGNSGSGNGTVTYSVSANTGAARTGTISIAGQTFTVNQAGSNPTSNGLQYFPLANPIRLLDTRAGQSACYAPGQPIAGQSVRTQPAQVTCQGLNIPATAAAIVGTATAANTPGEGHLRLYPSGEERPFVSNVNFIPGRTVSNSFTVKLGTNGAFDIFASSVSDVIIDVTGYYAPPAPGGLYYHPLPKPIRLLETRPDYRCSDCGYDQTAAPLAANQSRLQRAHISYLTPTITIPTTARVITGNATTVNRGFTTAGKIVLYPGDINQVPLTESINFVANQTIPNAFTVRLDNSGQFNIYTSAQTHFLIDVTGYYSTEAVDQNGTGLLFNILPKPFRLLDTRDAGEAPSSIVCDTPRAMLSAQIIRTQQVRNRLCNGQIVPSTAKVVYGNATVVNIFTGAANDGHIRLYPGEATLANASNLNYDSGDVIPNSFIVGLGATNGAINIYPSTTTHFIIDVSGYFAP
jgi:hypothetical protein